MILPKSMLDALEFYEETKISHHDIYGFHTLFTLHFKAWWKRNRQIRIRWDFHSSTNETTRWRMPEGAQELSEQLRDHFIERNTVLPLLEPTGNGLRLVPKK